MNPDEYDKLARIDATHWFYSGKRIVVRHWISRYIRLEPEDVLIDAGAGTGTLLVEMARYCRVIGLDNFEESLNIALPRIQAVGGKIIKTSLAKVDLPDSCARVVTLLDVLEHLDDDQGALREMVRLTRPQGLLILTVPALKMLWSDWDVALHHRRRYTRSEFLRLVDLPGVELLHCAYVNSLLFPPIALVRVFRRFFPRPPGAARAEDKIPPAWLNSLLRQLFVRPACWGWFHPPVGVSLLAVLRRAC